ncbi:hypothetical protein SORBI_3001G373850 [Sorghum bicolor]|uniref:Uncharacterized protein n=1 Tax=Sorghum bicolor TaxID=4558 RepID=A0A1Z5S9K6_SORBI|nr:hypothetical protein SORBI_3001G373850 [Sorghum bicolor]
MKKVTQKMKKNSITTLKYLNKIPHSRKIECHGIYQVKHLNNEVASTFVSVSEYNSFTYT